MYADSKTKNFLRKRANGAQLKNWHSWCEWAGLPVLKVWNWTRNVATKPKKISFTFPAQCIGSIQYTRSLLYFVQVFEKYSQEIFKTSCSAKISSFSNIYRYFILRVANLQSIWEAGKQYCEKLFLMFLSTKVIFCFCCSIGNCLTSWRWRSPSATSPSFATRHCHLPIRKMSSLPSATSLSFLMRHSLLPIRKMSSLP